MKLRMQSGGVEIERVTLSLVGQAIAVHVTDSNGRDDINYVFSDHLGSSSVVTAQNGSYNSTTDRAQHLLFGGFRGGTPAYLDDVTDRGFTGHKENSDIGLTYMNARYYVGYLNRFASADTIVPDPLNPQALNRYSYVGNRPIMLVDPIGHCGADPDDAMFEDEDGNQDGRTLDQACEDERGIHSGHVWVRDYW